MTETFKVQLEKDSYVPGEMLRGTVIMQNQQIEYCKRIEVLLEGGSSGQMYVSRKKIVWGNARVTPFKYHAGNNVVFGTPWAPDEGVLQIRINDNQNKLRVEVYDYYQSQNTKLGEVLLDLHYYISQSEDNHTVQLKTIDKSSKQEIEAGKLTFSMCSETLPMEIDSEMVNSNSIRFHIYSVTELQSVGWLGRNNNIYVVVRALPVPKLDPNLVFFTNGVALPSSMKLPFEFQLPNDLPSTFSSYYGSITYSISATIFTSSRDIRCKDFKVIQNNVTDGLICPSSHSLRKTIYHQICIPPFCCYNLPLCCCSYGSVNVESRLEKSIFAPGETIRLNTTIDCIGENKDAMVLSCSAQLLRIANFRHSSCPEEVGSITDVKPILTTNSLTLLKITNDAVPTYNGGLGLIVDSNDEVIGDKRSLQREIYDAITWQYYIRIRIQIDVPGCYVNSILMELNIPITIGGVSINELPTAQIEHEESHLVSVDKVCEHSALVHPSAPIESTVFARPTTSLIMEREVIVVEGVEFVALDE